MTTDKISDAQFYLTISVPYFFLFLYLVYLFASSMKTDKAVKEMRADLNERLRQLRDDLSTRFSGQSEIRELTSKVDTLQSLLNSSLKARVDALEQQMKPPAA